MDQFVDLTKIKLDNVKNVIKKFRTLPLPKDVEVNLNSSSRLGAKSVKKLKGLQDAIYEMIPKSAIDFEFFKKAFFNQPKENFNENLANMTDIDQHTDDMGSHMDDIIEGSSRHSMSIAQPSSIAKKKPIKLKKPKIATIIESEEDNNDEENEKQINKIAHKRIQKGLNKIHVKKREDAEIKLDALFQDHDMFVKAYNDIYEYIRKNLKSSSYKPEDLHFDKISNMFLKNLQKSLNTQEYKKIVSDYIKNRDLNSKSYEPSGILKYLVKTQLNCTNDINKINQEQITLEQEVEQLKSADNGKKIMNFIKNSYMTYHEIYNTDGFDVNQMLENLSNVKTSITTSMTDTKMEIVNNFYTYFSAMADNFADMNIPNFSLLGNLCKNIAGLLVGYKEDYNNGALGKAQLVVYDNLINAAIKAIVLRINTIAEDAIIIEYNGQRILKNDEPIDSELRDERLRNLFPDINQTFWPSDDDNDSNDDYKPFKGGDKIVAETSKKAPPKKTKEENSTDFESATEDIPKNKDSKTKKNSKMIIDDALDETEEEATTPKPLKPSNKEATSPKPLKPKPKSLKPSPIKTLLNRNEYTKRQKEQLTSQQLGSLAQLTEATTLLSNQVNPEQLKVEVAGVDYSNIPANNHFKAIQASVGKAKPEATTPMVVDEVSQLMSHLIRISRSLAQSLVGNTVIPQSIYSFYSSFISNLHLSNAETKLKLLQAKQKELEAYVKFPSAIIKAKELTRLYSRYFELTKSSVPVPKEAKVGGSETTVPMNVEDSEVASIMTKKPVKWSTPARTRIRAARPMSDSEVQARIKENDYAFRNTKADILSLGRNLTEEQQKDKESMNAYANALYDENLKLKVEMKIRYANNQLRSLQDVLANSDNDILKVEAKVKIGRIEKEMNEDLTALVNSIDDDDYIELTSMNVLETQTAAQVDPPVPPVSNTSIIQPQPSSELIPEPMPEVRPPDPVRVEQLVDPNLPDQFAIMADIERRNRARQPEATQPAVEELANSRGSSTIPAVQRQFTIMADIERRNRVDGTQQPAVVATRLPTSSNRVTGLEVEELANSRGFSTAPAVASNTFSSENMARFYNELRAADNRASSQQYSRLARSVANANMRDRIQGRVITDEGRLGVTTRESVNEILRRTREHTRETVQYYTTLLNRDVRRAEHLQRINMIGEELSAVQRSMDYHRTLIAETRRVGEETLAMLTDTLDSVPEERPQSTTPMVSDRPTTPINLENRATTPVVTYLDPNIQSTLNNLYRFIRTNRALTIRLASVTDFSERVAIEVQIESNINEMNSTINSLDQTARDAILNDVTVNSYMLERRMERQTTEQNMTNSNRTPQQRVDSAQYQATIKIKSAESAEFTPSRMVDNQIRRQFSETVYPEASVGRLAASVQGLKVYRDEYATRVTEYDELRRLLPNLSPHDMNPYETLAMLSTKLSKYEKALTLEDAETSRGWLTAVFIPVDKYISQAISQRLSRKQTDQIPRLILNMIESPEFLGQFIRAFGLSTEVVNRYGIFLDNLKKLYDNRFQFGISASTEVAAAIQSLTEIYLSMGTQNQELLNYYNINNTSSSSHYNNIYSDRAEIMLTSTALNYSVPEGMYNLSSLVETPLEEEPENYELDVERERRNIDQYVENMRTNMIPAILQLKNLLLNQAMQGDLPALNATNETLSRISTAANNWFREQILVFQILKNKIITLGYDPVKYRISLDAMKELLSSVNNIHNEIRSLLQTPTEIENRLRRSNYINDFATPQAIIEEFGNIDIPTSIAANANPPELPPSNLPQPQQPQQPSGSAPNTENNEDDNTSHMGEGISKIKKMHEERKRVTQEHKYEKHKPIPKLIIAHGIVTDHMNKSNEKKEAPKDVICEHCGRGILKNDNDDMHLSNTKEIMHKKCFSAKGCTPKRIPYKKAFGYDITEDSKNEQAKKLYQQKLEYKNYVDVRNDKDTNMFEEFIDSAQKYIKNPEKLLDLALKREIFVGPFNGRRLNELVFLIGAYNNTSEGEFNDTMLEHNLEIGIAKFLLNKDYKTTNETYLPSSNFEKLKNRILNSPGILANLHF